VGVVVLSIIEVEYMATTHGNKEAILLQILCSGIGFFQKAMRIGYDN